MNIKSCLITMSVLTLGWGCSSSDDTTAQTSQSSNQQSEFTESEKPNWNIDWHWSDPMPQWQESPRMECSMQLRAVLSEDMAAYSGNDDRMAVFMNGTCRGISLRNVVKQDSQVVFLLNIQGEPGETGSKMELQYYCSELQQLFRKRIPYFEPNNLWGEQYETTFDLSTGGTKYPIHTQLEVSLPGNPSYEDTKNDLVYAFVGDECRGILMPSADTKGFKGFVYSRTEGEQAQLRYYRASQKGYYTLKQLIDLNGFMQNVVFEY